MGKISDIWVRLGLKKDDFDKGMDDAAKKTEDVGGAFGKMKATALAAWAVIGTAVTKFAKDLIASTNRMGDAWAVFTSQSKAAWDTFLSAVSSWDFSNFFGRLKQATMEAAEFAKAMDMGFEVNNSIALQRAAMSDELAALKITMQDATKPYEVRIKAAEDYLAKVKPLYDQIEAEAKRVEDAHLGNWLAGSGLGDTEQVRADLRKFLVDIGQVRGLYDQLAELQKYSDAADRVKAGSVESAVLGKKRDEIRAAIESMVSGYNTDILGLFRVYNDMRGDKDTAPLVQAMIDAFNSAGLYKKETAEIQSVMNGLVNQATTAAVTEAAKNVPKDVAKGLQKDLNAFIKDLSIVPDLGDLEAEIDLSDIETIEPMDWDTILGDYDAELYSFLDKWRATQEEIAMLNGMLEGAIVASMSNGLQAITDMMAGIEGANAGAVLGALMQPFADTAIQLGEMLIAQGLGVEAFKKSLESLNGVAAIAAGAALVALGSAMRSGISALSKGGGAASTASYSGGGSSYGNVENYQSELTIYVEGKISGSDIVLAGNKTLKNWRR